MGDNSNEQPNKPAVKQPPNPYVLIDMRYAENMPFGVMQSVMKVAEATAELKKKAQGPKSVDYIIIETSSPLADKVDAFIIEELRMLEELKQEVVNQENSEEN